MPGSFERMGAPAAEEAPKSPEHDEAVREGFAMTAAMLQKTEAMLLERFNAGKFANDEERWKLIGDIQQTRMMKAEIHTDAVQRETPQWDSLEHDTRRKVAEGVEWEEAEWEGHEFSSKMEMADAKSSFHDLTEKLIKANKDLIVAETYAKKLGLDVETVANPPMFPGKKRTAYNEYFVALKRVNDLTEEMTMQRLMVKNPEAAGPIVEAQVDELAALRNRIKQMPEDIDGKMAA